jgi:Domain of unknown function (DUF1931)
VVVTSVPRFERFVRETAGVDVDKADVKRYAEFVNQKLYDLLLVGQAHAGANGRDIVESCVAMVSLGLAHYADTPAGGQGDGEVAQPAACSGERGRRGVAA